MLRKEKTRIPELIYALLDQNFHESLHNEILDTIDFRINGFTITA